MITWLLHKICNSYRYAYLENILEVQVCRSSVVNKYTEKMIRSGISSPDELLLKGYFTYCKCETKLVLHIDRAIFCSV